MSIIAQNRPEKTKKSFQICSKIAKNTIFLKFQLWADGRECHKIGRKLASMCAQFNILTKKFFVVQIKKLTILFNKNIPPVPESTYGFSEKRAIVIEGTARPSKKPDWGDGQKMSFEIISGTGFQKKSRTGIPYGFSEKRAIVIELQ